MENNVSIRRVDGDIDTCCMIEDELKELRSLHGRPASLKQYKTLIDNYRFALVEYWCLCQACHNYNPEHEKFSLWKTRLEQIIRELMEIDLEKGINRRRTLTKMLVRDYDYDKPEMIMRIIREEISMSDKMDCVAADFAANIGELIDVIAGRGVSVEEYMAKKF